MRIAERLLELGLELPKPIIRPAGWRLLPYQIHGDLLYLSGHGPRSLDAVVFNGRLGESLSLEQGIEAARLCMLNLLCTTQTALGNLDRVKQVIKVFGMVKCTQDFHYQPEVINGASELLLSIFDDRGSHARTAIGVYDLPRGISVEVEMVLSFN